MRADLWLPHRACAGKARDRPRGSVGTTADLLIAGVAPHDRAIWRPVVLAGIAQLLGRRGSYLGSPCNQACDVRVQIRELGFDVGLVHVSSDVDGDNDAVFDVQVHTGLPIVAGAHARAAIALCNSTAVAGNFGLHRGLRLRQTDEGRGPPRWVRMRSHDDGSLSES